MLCISEIQTILRCEIGEYHQIYFENKMRKSSSRCKIGDIEYLYTHVNKNDRLRALAFLCWEERELRFLMLS